jgi:5-methylcytosine-specific restriction endonuclease McrA
MEALKKYGTRCQCCGATPADGVKMNVDHIKPRKLFPQLALDISNLQVLCEVCNHGKGNWDMTDWRQKDGISSQPESVG